MVPKPLQRPHPPIFQPFASSERSIRWCAEEGVTAVLPPLHPTLEARLVALYAEVSGRPPGDGIGVLRDVVVAPTDDEAMALWRDSGAFCGAAWFEPFGFVAGSTIPRAARDPTCSTPAWRWSAPSTRWRASSSGCARACRVDWLFAWTYNGLVPHAALMRSIELFATRVLPRAGG